MLLFLYIIIAILSICCIFLVLVLVGLALTRPARPNYLDPPSAYREPNIRVIPGLRP